MVDLVDVLGRHPFFASLDPDSLGAVARRTVIRVYEKGSLVYLEGEPVSGLFVVASGQIRVFKMSTDGREQDLFHASVGESINEASALDGQPTMANAQATEASVVLLIGREALASLIREYPQIGLEMSRVLAGRLRDMAQLAGDLSLRGVLPRMAGLLLRLAGASSVAKLPTRNELAAMVGTVREVASRSLRQLESSGAIRLDTRSAVILDRAQLSATAGGSCPAYPRARSAPFPRAGLPASCGVAADSTDRCTTPSCSTRIGR
jgi:CRP-like cAMP-binding protein